MIAAAHFSAGVVAGMAASRSRGRVALRCIVAFAIGLASHAALDAIPHADYGSLPETRVAMIIAAEAVGIALVSVAILRQRVQPGWLLPMLAGLFGATLPDIGFAANLLLPRHIGMRVHRAGDAFHGGFHARGPTLSVGVTTQIASVVILLAALFAFPKKDAGAKPDVS